ncbi:MAG: hypothetical protein Q9159_003554 [Coniocarpon cinnabarinum]
MNVNLRLTPRASPGPRTPTTKSPIKTIHEEPQYLSLHKVIGSTVASSNAVDHVERLNSVAYTAGAAVVLAKVHNDFQVIQRTFRAAAAAVGKPGGVSHSPYDSPFSSPLAKHQRNRASVLPRDLLSSPAALNSVTLDSHSSPGIRNTTQYVKSKTASCLSLSHDGKWLAMGETGWKPRVHVFALTTDGDKSHGPVCTFAEHIIGVKSVAFSPDSKFLATLGDINDGFLNIWSINQKSGAATLHASNKCISNVRTMKWMGNSLVTIGTRHVKIWRVNRNPQASPSKRFDTATLASPSKTLSGRNCILGPLLDKTYVSIVAVDHERAIICSNEGDICLLEDSEANLSIRQVGHTDGTVSCACISAGTSLLIGEESGRTKSFSLDSLLRPQDIDQALPAPQTSARSFSACSDMVGLAPAKDCLIGFCSSGTIAPFDKSGSSPTKSSSPLLSQLQAHQSAVCGVISASFNGLNEASFLTFAADGSVVIWDFDGSSIKKIEIPLMSSEACSDDSRNELKAVTTSARAAVIYSGDALGNLRVTDLHCLETTCEVKAHEGDVTCIESYQMDDTVLVASGSRDRTVQVFRQHSRQLELIQTLDDHAGALTCIKFSPDGSKMVSCAADRSVLVRTCVGTDIEGSGKIAYVSQRTIALKATPLSLTMFSQDGQDLLMVSTMDKSLARYSLQDSQINESFKTGDDDDGDLVALNCVTPISWNKGKHAIAGVSSSDKSVRIYNEAGNLLSREYGHTEGLSGIVAIRRCSETLATRIVSTASDGTIFMWDLAVPQEGEINKTYLEGPVFATPQIGAAAASWPPIRKVLSSSELAQLQSNLPDSRMTSGSLRTRSQSPKRKVTKPSQHEAALSAPIPSLSANRRAKNASEPPHGITDPNEGSDYLKEPTKPISKRLRRQSSQPVMSSRDRQTDYAIDDPQRRPSPDLRVSTQNVCRALHIYRKRIANSDDHIPVEQVRELEKELSQTAKALAEKAARNDAVVEKLLDRYGERLVEIMERRIDEKVDKLVVDGTLMRGLALNEAA